MMSYAEHLPVEIWLPIFSYLEAHDLFNAFNNLNYYFNQILACSYLKFHLNLEKNDNNFSKYLTNAYWSDSILNRITYLQLSNNIQSNYFIEWHFKKFLQLQSLIIDIDLSQIPIICQVLPQINSLKYLSIVCIMTPSLFQSILNISKLHVCRLSVRKETDTHDYHSVTNSNLEILYIIPLNKAHNYYVKPLLCHMPKLKRLEISNSVSSFTRNLESLLIQPIFNSSNLQILKYKLEGYCVRGQSFDSLYCMMDKLIYSSTEMHNFKYVDINICNINMNEYLWDDIHDNWWFIFTRIEKVKISIHGYYEKQLSSTRNLNDYQQMLLSKNNQLNNCFKIEWIENNFKTSHYMEITINITKLIDNKH